MGPADFVVEKMRILGLDFGSRTVGVAVSDELLLTAQGLETIERKDENKLRKTCARIEEIIKEYGVDGAVIYACGPTPMLRGIKAYAMEKGIECQISMEEKMACGVGACLACVCKTKDIDEHSQVHNRRICKD